MALIIESNVSNENYSLIFRFCGVRFLGCVPFVGPVAPSPISFSRAFYRRLAYAIAHYCGLIYAPKRKRGRNEDRDREIELKGARNELINNQ